MRSFSTMVAADDVKGAFLEEGAGGGVKELGGDEGALGDGGGEAPVTALRRQAVAAARYGARAAA